MRCLGVGSPLVDLLARVDETFLRDNVPGAKGGMEMVAEDFIAGLLSRLPEPPQQVAGGSAGNTIFAMAELQCDVAMFGKLGGDPNGDFYRRTLRELGGSDREFIVTDAAPTGVCLSLITPDAERTMRSSLGASLLLTAQEADRIDFNSFDLVYIEGYMLFSPVFRRVLELARAAGCRIGIDLSSFEVAEKFRAELKQILPECVDIVLANAEEAAALFCGEGTPDDHLDWLADWCDIAAVKLGRDGALVRRGAEKIHIASCLVEHPVDTTAAGDYWAAGFLCGLGRGEPLARAAWYGSLLSGEIVKVIGAKLPENSWKYIRQAMAR